MEGGGGAAVTYTLIDSSSCLLFWTKGSGVAPVVEWYMSQENGT